jgi:hypothetical protein
MAKTTVGPVIGKVTDTTARILIEVDGDVQITCDATDTRSYLKNHIDRFGNAISLSIFQARLGWFVFLR